MKNVITYLKTLWSSVVGSQRNDVEFDRRLTVGSPSGFTMNWTLKLVSVLVLVLTIGIGNVWGAPSVISYNQSTKDTETSVTSSNISSGTAGKVSWTATSATWNSKKSRWDIAVAGTLTFTVQSGYVITQIVATTTSNKGTFSVSPSATITGNGSSPCTISGLSASSVTITISGQTHMINSSITVTYEASGGGCDKNVTITKGTPESGGSFDLDKTGSQATCSGLTVTVSNIVAPSGKKFSAITQSGIASGVTINQSAKTVTYAANTTGSSTINVTYEDKGCTDHGASSITTSASTSYTTGPVDDYKYSTRQILYTKSDLALDAGKKGTIKSIYFKYAGSSAMTKKTSVDIYLANTSLTALASGTAVPYSAFTKVYSGPLNFSAAGWQEFLFNVADFDYDGVGCLAVMIDDNSFDYDGKAFTFNVNSSSGAQIYKHSDTTNENPSTINWSSDVTATNERPNAKFCIQEADMVQYTVNWYVNGSLAHSQTGYPGTTLTSIPVPTKSDCDGSKDFVGWYTNTYSHATNAPAFVTPSTIPVGGANYYAVFATATTNYKIATKADLLEGTKVVLVNGTNAVSSSVTTTDKLDPVSISSKLSDGVIANPGSNIIWTVALDGTKYKFKQSTNYLNAVSGSGSAGKLYCNATSDSWSINTSSTYYYLQSTNASNRKLEYYNSLFTSYNGTPDGNYWIDFYVQVFTNYETNCCTQLGSVSGSVSCTSGTAATLSWSAVTGAESYKVKVPGSSSHNDWTTATTGVSVTGLTAGNSYTAYFKALDSNGSHCAEGPESTVAFTTPKITVTGTPSAMSYIYGNGPSTAQSFTVAAVGMAGDVTVAAPSNFQVSKTGSTSGFANSVTLSPSSGTVSSTTIYVRMITDLAEGSYGPSNVTVSGNYAASVNVSVSGTVSPACENPTINTQPAASASYNMNVTATALSVVATKNGTGPALTYQWYSNTANSKTTPTPAAIDGATSASYTPPTTATGTKYYFCEVSSGACAVTTNISAITVSTPSITVSETSIAFGDKAKDGSHTATFTVSGSNLAYNTGLTLGIEGSGYFTIDKSSVAQTSAGTVTTTTVTVTYAPTVIGDSHSATITISSTGATSKTVTLSGNSKYKITWVDQAANPATETYTYVASGKPTFPSNPSGGCDSYTYFYGWAEGTFTTPVTAPTSSSTIKVYKAASEMPNVSGNVTYYAVWADSPGGWSKETSSIAANDVIVIVNETNTKEIKSVGNTNTSVADTAWYTSTPRGVYELTVKTGNQTGTFAFQNGSDYLTYSGTATSGSNYLWTTTSITDDSSWGVSFDGDGNAIITSYAADNKRYIRYNSGQPRFACYYSASGTPSQNPVQIYKKSAAGNCVTSCCTEVADRSGSIDMSTTSATVSWSVTGTAASKISSWDVSCVVTSTKVAAGTKGSLTTSGTTKSIEFTGLQPNTGYTFHILGTSNDDAYCDVDDELTGTTECATPVLSVTGTWGLCVGENLSLSLTETSNIDPSATYQWKKYNSSTSSWDNIGTNAATYSVTGCSVADAGSYTCTVTNPGSGSCSTTSDAFGVKVYTIYIDNGNGSGWEHVALVNDGTNKGKVSIELDADKTYQFKVYDNNNAWSGQTGTDNIPDATTWTLNGSNNVKVATRLGGDYLFEVNYASTPTVKVTFPDDDQAVSKKIWFDNSIRNWSTMYYRVGNTGTNQNSTSFTLVPGTDKFYVVNTLAQSDVAAWHIANNPSWAGSNSIYKVDGSGYAITEATAFQKYLVGSNGVTLVPTSKTGTSDGCDWYGVTKTDGMLTHNISVGSPANGTLVATYTNTSGTTGQTVTEGNNADLAHRCIVTITATPDAGYNLNTLTVNGGAFTSGNTHILAADATVAASFSAKTITVTWNVNGGNTLVSGTSSYTYDGDALVLPTPTKDGKVFAGWFTSAEGGSEVTNVGGANKPTADVEYYAHWSDGNRVVFHPGAGTVASPGYVTQTSLGGSVTLVTPTPTCDGWTFHGWKVGSEQTDVTELPEGLLDAGSSYVPASATVNMYAVYKKTIEETTPVTSTYTWDSDVSGWSMSNISKVNGTTGIGGSKYGKFSANGAYAAFNSKVNATSFSFYLRRPSNNEKGTIKIQKRTATDAEWEDVNTWIVNATNFSDKTELYQKSASFDGKTAYYLRMYYVADGSADREVDNVSITYKQTSNVTHYVTSPLECSQVTTPVIDPEGDTFTGAHSITITCATDGATIKYTTDDSDPSSSNGTTIASGSSFTLSCSGTVKAIAYKDGMEDSEIASETYTIKVPDPTFSPDGGDFNVAQSVSLSNALAGTTVHYTYTTDGSEPTDPTSSSPAYSTTPISVAVGQTVRIKAIGINACCTNSDIVSKTFRVGWDFELVTSEDDLNVGDKIVILSGTTNALSTYNPAGNNRTSSSDFDISSTTVTAYPPSTNSATTVQVITLAGEPGAWKLVTSATQWLNCPSAGKLTTVTTDGSGAEDLARRRWSIDVGSSPNYYATITNNQETTATIQYSSVFAAYATSQSPVKIYSIPTTDPVLKVDGTLSAFTGCTSEASAAQSFYVSGKNLSASISVAAPTGYEVSLSSGSGYGSSVEVTRVGTTVSKTQVYVRLKAGDAGAVAAANVVVSVEANSLSQNVAIPASSIAAADTYIDRMHGAEPTNECGSYSAPVLDDGDMETGTDCQKNYAIFQGWVAEDDINLDGTLKAGATIVAGGASKTASGTTYYSIWEALVE